MVSIVLPAYNEAANLTNILPKIRSALKDASFDYEILVIDTVQPTDNTKTICEKNSARYISRAPENFYGDAIRTGFASAGGEYIVVMDADGSHDPAEITRFYSEIQSGNYDLIIGSRYCKGGNTDNNFFLKFMSWLLNVTYRVMFGLKVKDVSDSFRMYKADQIRSMKFECDNFDIVEEILVKLNLTVDGFSAKEVPISFQKRAEGESKRDLGKFILSYIKTMQRLLQIARKTKTEKKEKDRARI